MRTPFLLLVTTIFFTGCVSRNIPPAPDLDSLRGLPPELQVEHISFANLLGIYDSLNDQQRLVALQYFLSRENPGKREKAEASYMLGCLYQNSHHAQHQPHSLEIISGDQALELFGQAEMYPALKLRSLWHKSELAAGLGKEKLVRKSLNDILDQVKDSSSMASAQYALAQSYLRANEIDRAVSLFKKIRADFPHTDYSFGSGYYLGTLAYTQFAKQLSANKPFESTLFKTVSYYYFEYLQASPSGHFAQDILSKLANLIGSKQKCWAPNRNQWAVIAKAYSASGQYRCALSAWQKAGMENHLLSVADCLTRLGQISTAQDLFLKSLAKKTCPPEYLFLADEICLRLNKVEAAKFWQRLRSSGFCHQDEVLWNLAIRSSLPQALNYYQEILARYPDSNHAPQAQWRIFWHKFKLSQDKLPLARLGAASANKYDHSKLAARFLFWTAKIFEALSNKEQACLFYKQAADLFPYDYYGVRSHMRYLALQNIATDNFFSIQEPGILLEHRDWPAPESAIDQLNNKDHSCAFELIYLKQYAEALDQDQSNCFQPVVISWLNGKTGQSLAAINIAFQALQEQSAQSEQKPLLQYYSYPLLYNQQIIYHCRNMSFADPLLVHALIREESRYNPNAVSQAKALGLCQLMPATASGVAKQMGIKFTNAKQLYQPDINLKLGIAYLSSLLRTFQGNKLLAIAGYNAGVNAVKNQLPKQSDIRTGDPDCFLEDFPFRETRDYIRNVFASYWSYRQIYERN